MVSAVRFSPPKAQWLPHHQQSARHDLRTPDPFESGISPPNTELLVPLGSHPLREFERTPLFLDPSSVTGSLEEEPFLPSQTNGEAAVNWLDEEEPDFYTEEVVKALGYGVEGVVFHVAQKMMLKASSSPISRARPAQQVNILDYVEHVYCCE